MLRKTNRFINHHIFLAIFLLFATCVMGIGYASVSGIFVNIDGQASVLIQSALFISRIIYKGDVGAIVNSSHINDFSGTLLNSSITLGNSSSSSITYTVTITNSTDDNYVFAGTSYSSSFYDNPNITYDISGINNGDIIPSNTSNSFDITFHYTGSNTSNPTLNSYINFDFGKYYTITYQNINTSGHNYPTYVLESENTKTITFSGDVPYDVSITPSSTTYTYNNNTGVLTLSNVSSNISINRYYSLTYITSGTNPSNQPTKYLHGETVSLLSPTDGVNRFDGWYLNSSYIGNVITNTSGYYENLTLYAKWISPYTITYILNGGTQANNQVTSFFTDTPQNILDPTNIHDPEFSGWYQNSGFTGSIISSTGDLNGNSTLYAKWTSTINNTTYNTSTNRFVASNASNVRLNNFTNNTYTQNTAHTTINSIKVYVTYTSSNKSSVLTCQVGGQQATINISTNQTNAIGEATITLSTPIQSGSSYTVSCPSTTGSGNLKITVNGFEFMINP